MTAQKPKTNIAAKPAAPSPQPDKCPSCGSPRKRRNWKDAGIDCVDLWHKAPVGAQPGEVPQIEKTAAKIMNLYEDRRARGYDAPAFAEIVAILEHVNATLTQRVKELEARWKEFTPEDVREMAFETNALLEKRAETAEVKLATLTRQLEEAQRELDREAAQHLITIDDRDSAQDALQQTHIALGGDGEWVTRMPEPEPPESGDLRKDVPVIAAQIFEAAKEAQESAETAETKLATLTRRLAQLKEALQAAFDYLPREYYGGDPDGDDTLQALNRKLEAALRQIEESK